MSRPAMALMLALLAGATAGCGRLMKERYEYEEEIVLALDGSAVVNVNASEAALVALRGAPLDAGVHTRPNRAAIRAMYSAPGVTPKTPTFSRRNGRRFVHVSLETTDVRRLSSMAPFAWSTYRLDRQGETVRFRQTVGKAAGKPVDGVSWTGRERVAFRMRIPSRVLFENGTSDVQRGNIVAWEQPLSDRLAGVPVDVDVQMEPESILQSTLLLFAGTVAAAAVAFAVVIWRVVRRGERELAAR